MVNLILIAAVGRNLVIGNDGDLAWKNKEDMRHFKELTLHHPVIMGRKTWDSLPERYRPLPNRRNIILTRNQGYQPQGAEIYHSLEDALDHTTGDVYVIGGEQIYKLAMPLAKTLELTEVDQDLQGDIFFPRYDDWTVKKREEHDGFAFVTYGR
jgi:dihydrofolate reductase